MKIGIYSDLHISKTSSIIPLYNGNGNYTTRLQMIIDTGRWMYETFDKNNVDIIVNCGDTLDSSVVKAEELSALNQFYGYSKGIKEYHIVGNHEMSDSNGYFYSNSILSAFDFIEIIDVPKTIELDKKISFLPYRKTEDIPYAMIEKLKADILFSHIDIKGSKLRCEYILDTGVEPEYLADNFSLTINGHLHTPEVVETTHNRVINIGSVSSISFVDSNTYIPSVCILDTDTMEIERFNNPHSILFRRHNCNNVQDMLEYLRKLNPNYKYILNITCPFNIKQEIKNIVENEEKILAHRIILDTNEFDMVTKKSNDLNIQSMLNVDVKDEFIKFIKENNLNTYGKIEKYIEVINM